ncbi:helix-turn-helix transcriptional regulator [Pseudoalteromonas sp. MMG013]|uniref:helix-turn-helix transcriptional regulator n=1 Tax=unclassified Pseudoalteromonas TaxID=194690 RepID=UPI001B365875|nr:MULTISPECIES: helix-turn-helix transcriptional regulator [unclassified Pseudoalteromonas]MBQ4850714.1 helix-turn-helix transcriptional regulator [Pseudoalteromonas sp. MMG012]MBQ4862689.1 helix-turn-helix transcriptional regulator [Pseudoalteromonas sp. MMG013]
MKNNSKKRQTKINRFEKELQKSIRNLRKTRGLTQKQLGNMLGVDQATISNFESGKTVMSITQVYEMLLIFGNDFSSPNIAQLMGNNQAGAALVA